jgi:hypothetical protein
MSCASDLTGIVHTALSSTGATECKVLVNAEAKVRATSPKKSYTFRGPNLPPTGGSTAYAATEFICARSEIREHFCA